MRITNLTDGFRCSVWTETDKCFVTIDEGGCEAFTSDAIRLNRLFRVARAGRGLVVSGADMDDLRIVPRTVRRLAHAVLMLLTDQEVGAEMSADLMEVI